MESIATSSSSNDYVTVLRSEVYDFRNPYHYGWFTVNMAIGICMIVAFLNTILPRITYGNVGTTYRDLPIDKQRNVIAYIVRLVVMTTAFGFAIKSSYHVTFDRQSVIETEGVEMAFMALHMISLLHVWELTYRLKHSSLALMHHTTTFIFIQLGFATFFDPPNIPFMRVSIAMSFYATTDQLRHFALLCYRLKLFPKNQSRLFQASAVQSTITRIAITTCIVAYFIVIAFIRDDLSDISPPLRWFWFICFLPRTIIVCHMQIRGTDVLCSLAQQCESTRDGETDCTDKPSKVTCKESKALSLESLENTARTERSCLPMDDDIDEDMDDDIDDAIGGDIDNNHESESDSQDESGHDDDGDDLSLMEEGRAEDVGDRIRATASASVAREAQDDGAGHV